MKVYIGNYPNRLTCRIHTRYMDRKYGYIDWPTEQSRFENFLEKLEDFVQTCYTPINYFLDKREQKVKIHIDRWDTWSMDHTLAPIILPMLKQLKENKHGAPNVDWEDVPRELRPSKEELRNYNKNGETDPNFFKRWDYVLDEMIWAFSEHVKDYEEGEGKFHTGTHDTVFTPIDEEGNEVSKDDARWFRMDKGPNDTSHFDKEGYEAWLNRKQNGFRLFGKYYTSLWD